MHRAYFTHATYLRRQKPWMHRRAAALLLYLQIALSQLAITQADQTAQYLENTDNHFVKNWPATQNAQTNAASSTPRVNRALQLVQKATRSLLRGRRFPAKPAQRAHAPLGCQQFKWPNETHSIAVIGNGPLSVQQRLSVEVSSQIRSLDLDL